MMKRNSAAKLIGIGILVLLLVLVAHLLPPNLFSYWDFRNNLWGPAHLLVNQQSPYFIKQLFPETNAIWMPPIIGLMLPMGLISFPLAANIWFLLILASTGAIIYIYINRSHLPRWKLVLILIAVFFFPPLTLHLSLGQISTVITLCLILVSLPTGSPVWKGLCIVIALTKPQLAILVLPGILIHTIIEKGFPGFLRLCAAALAWAAVLIIPFFILYPGWIADFIIAVTGNANWAQPSLLFFLKTQFGSTPGLITWGILALLTFGLNLWLWIKLPSDQAIVWSLAFTCLASPYIWSWDFVLLLPCILYLLGKYRDWLPFSILLLGFLCGSFLIWKIRWNASVSDEVFYWVPVYMLSICLISLLIQHWRRRPPETLSGAQAVQ